MSDPYEKAPEEEPVAGAEAEPEPESEPTSTSLPPKTRISPTPDDPLDAVIQRAMKVGAEAPGSMWYDDMQRAGAFEELRSQPREDIARIAVRVAERRGGLPRTRQHAGERSGYRSILGAALRRKLSFDADQLAVLIAAVPTLDDWSWTVAEQNAIVRAVERFDGGLTEDHTALLERAAESLRAHSHKDARKLVERIDELLGNDTAPPISSGEAWTDAALADIAASPQRAAWTELLLHCSTAKAGKPTAAWSRKATKLRGALDADAFRDAVVRWFALADKVRTTEVEVPRWGPDPNRMLSEASMDVLKGLAWACVAPADPELARALCRLAISANKKVAGIGPRAVRVGNACIWALGNMPGLDAVGQLAVLKVRTRTKAAQISIDKALTTAAEREGLPRAEVEEMAVPAYGLDEVGKRTEVLGNFTASVVITEGGGVELRWFKPDGSRQKSVPAAVKRDHADELKELKAATKDVQKMVSAQKQRLDRLYRRREPWPFALWRDRYLDHPLVGALTRRLIWSVGGIACGWTGDRLESLDGTPVEPADDAPVVLWHPLDASTDDTLRWRAWLADRQIVQPFKQAHREVYVLTPAEEETEVYSNRFAAHLLRQHAMSSLCAQRDWTYALQLIVDDSFPPAQLALSEWGLRAEFWVAGAGDEYGTDTNQTGVYLYVRSDQVRFYPADAPQTSHIAFGVLEVHGDDQPVPLRDVPAKVLSEVLRDVDLFVGVCSVGNDPAWADSGARPEWRDYWQGYAFGELTTTAEIRKQVLEALLPKLKIRDVARVDGRYVVVRGKRAEYAIHIGSGNIQIRPDNRYLCIVPKSATAGQGKMYLPFEGDRTLSIVISKALMLADDDKIQDPTISRQLPDA